MDGQINTFIDRLIKYEHGSLTPVEEYELLKELEERKMIEDLDIKYAIKLREIKESD